MSKRPATSTPKQRVSKKMKKSSSVSLINPPRASRFYPEKKNADILTVNPITFNQVTGNVALFNGLVPGTSGTTRIGRKIRMVSISYRFQGGYATSSTSTGSSPLRMLIIYDKQTNGATPAAGSVLTLDVIESPMSLGNSQRFIVIADEIIDSYTPSATGSQQAFYRKGFKKLNLVTEFNAGTAGTVSDINTGGVFALFYQDGNILVGNPPVTCYSRIMFEDV